MLVEKCEHIGRDAAERAAEHATEVSTLERCIFLFTTSTHRNISGSERHGTSESSTPVWKTLACSLACSIATEDSQYRQYEYLHR